MQKRIEDIQKEIDELIRFCGEAAGADFADESLESNKFSKLGYLILRLQDGDLNDRCIQTLGQWLCSDKEALDYYIEFQNLSSLLHGYFNTQRQEKLLGKTKDFTSIRNNR